MRVVISARELKEIVIGAILEGMFTPANLSGSKCEKLEDYINDTETKDIDIESSNMVINVPERN